MRKILTTLLITLLSILLFSCKTNGLPKPQVEEGLRKDLGIDANINEKTIDNYLNREDSVYIDCRMLKDPAKYEAIGGDSYLSGIIKGFEVVPYPYLCNPKGLPDDVGEGYNGNALFSQNEDGTYKNNYEESIQLVENIFPKDKYIFLMCGGGGYAGMCKNLLVSLGYDENRIYNIGGYWYYEGNNSIQIKKEENGQTTYNFDLLTYHEFDFDSLKPINGYIPKENSANNEFIEQSTKMINLTSVDELYKLIDNNKTFLLYIYLPGCTSCAEFKPIVEDFIEINDVDVYQINFQLTKDEKNIISATIDYTPSMFIFRNGELVSYLDASADKDYETYKTCENLSKWIAEHIDVDIVKTKSQNEKDDCGDACKL